MSPNSLPHDHTVDQEALPPFDILYDRYHAQVYRYLHAHLKHEHDAADLMQQVFFQAWRQGQTYEPSRGSVATWLLGIAHHRLVDFYRMSRSSIPWESISEIPAMDQNPEAKVLSEESIALVRRLLEALSQPEQDRTRREPRKLLARALGMVVQSGQHSLRARFGWRWPAVWRR